MLKLVSIYVIVLWVALAWAECPSMGSLPVMHNKVDFYCARQYYGPGGDHPIQACNGCFFGEYEDIQDGRDAGGEEGYRFPTGSLMVMPGCILYAFSDYDFGGTVYEFPTGTYPNVQAPVPGSADNCADGFYSNKCRCEQKLISCTPVDSM